MDPAERDRRALPSLTGMRFIAVFLVFGGHAMAEGLFRDGGIDDALVGPSLAGSTTGVSFFFVLSGFILTWSAHGGEPARAFWRRRFFRLYPVNAVTWVISAVIGLAVGNVVLELMNIPSAFMLQALFPRPYAINEPTWSLSVEVFFYLLFPVLLRRVRRIRAERLWLWAVVVAGAIVVVTLAVGLLPSQPWTLSLHMTWVQFWLVYSFPPVRALEFVLGMIMARVVQQGRWIPLRLWQATGLVLVGYLVKVFTVTSPYGIVLPTLVPLALLIPAAASADLDARSSLMASSVFQWLGKISFAFFMVHYMVLHFGRLFLFGNRTFPVPDGVGFLAVAFLVAVLCAWLLYVGIEQPFLRRYGRPLKPKASTPAGAPAVGPPAGCEPTPTPDRSERRNER